ncbi:hypothetical protein Tco_0039541 [Tanacetum coccineum]
MPPSLVTNCTSCANDKENFTNERRMPQNSDPICEISDIWGIETLGPVPVFDEETIIFHWQCDNLTKWLRRKRSPTNDALEYFGKFLLKSSPSFSRWIGAPRAIINVPQATHFFVMDQLQRIARIVMTPVFVIHQDFHIPSASMRNPINPDLSTNEVDIQQKDRKLRAKMTKTEHGKWKRCAKSRPKSQKYQSQSQYRRIRHSNRSRNRRIHIDSSNPSEWAGKAQKYN